MITITEKENSRVLEIMKAENYDPTYFVRVAVESGGCSGLSYKLNFDNEEKKGDQVFEVEGIKICLDIKSYLYLAGTELDRSEERRVGKECRWGCARGEEEKKWGERRE